MCCCVGSRGIERLKLHGHVPHIEAFAEQAAQPVWNGKARFPAAPVKD